MREYLNRILISVVSIILGVLIGRFLIPKPMDIVPLERLEVQIELINELDRMMNLCMNEYDRMVEPVGEE